MLGLYSRGQNDKKMVVHGDLPVSHSPDPARRMPVSPTNVRDKRQSLSPVSRRDHDVSLFNFTCGCTFCGCLIAYRMFIISVHFILLISLLNLLFLSVSFDACHVC